MKKSIFLYSLAFLIIFPSCFYKQYDPATHENKTGAYIPMVKGVKKKQLYLKTYPPSDLTAGLADYHKKFNQFPLSFPEFSKYSIKGSNALQQMLQTNYTDVSVGYSSADSMIINYEYAAMNKDDEARQKQMVINRKYRGKYIYTFKNGGVQVENVIKKRR